MNFANSTLQNKEKSQKNALTYCIYQIKVYFTINKPTTHKKKLLPRPIVVQHFTLIQRHVFCRAACLGFDCRPYFARTYPSSDFQFHCTDLACLTMCQLLVFSVFPRHHRAYWCAIQGLVSFTATRIPAYFSDLLQLVPPNRFSICWDICLWLFNLTTYRCATQPNPSAKLLIFFHIAKLFDKKM